MKQLEWSIEYSTGIVKIDAQHAYLFELANRLLKKGTHPQDNNLLDGIIRELNDYVETHFAYEEAIMAEAKYDHLEEHKKLHQIMRTRLDLFTAQLREGVFSGSDLSDFLEQWLTLHIMREDMKYIPALSKLLNASKK